MCESTTTQEMTSMEVLHPQNGAPESLDSSEYSIIPNPSPPSDDFIENGLVNGNFNLENLHSALMSATPDLSVEELQSRVADLVEDNVLLREKLQKHNDMMRDQLCTISAWHNQMTTSMSTQQLNLKEALEKIDMLVKENTELCDKVKELESKPLRLVDSGTSTQNNITPLSDEDVDFEFINRKELKKNVNESKLEAAEKKIADLLKTIEDKNNLIEDLNKKSVDDSIAKLECKCPLLKDKIKILEQELAKQDAKLVAEKSSHEETKKMFTIVQTNYDRVTKLLQIQSKDEKEKDVDIEREADTKMYLEKIDNVTAQLLDTQDQLQEQEEKVKSMTSELNMLKEEAETIPILKAQVEVYKIDLNSISLARDAAKEEVNRLTKQIHETSVVSLCDSCKGSINLTEGSSRGKRPKTISMKPELKQMNDYILCPICGHGFTSLKAAENHVNDCCDKIEKPYN